MSNENHEHAISQGVMQYLGAYISSLNLEKEEVPHVGVAKLTEIALELATKDNSYSLYACKPILRAAILIIKDRMAILEKANKKADPAGAHLINKQMKEYAEVTKVLQRLIDNTKKGDL